MTSRRSSRGDTVGMPARRRFAPFWVYAFGLFALAAFQRLVFPPDDHSTAAAVAFFAIGALVVVGVLTLVQRRTT